MGIFCYLFLKKRGNPTTSPRILPLCCLVSALLVFNVVGASAQDEVEQPAEYYSSMYLLTIQRLIDSVTVNNDRLQSALEAIRASKAAIRAQKAIDPPLVGVELSRIPVGKSPIDAMVIQYSVEQMVMYPGKIRTMTDVMRQETAMRESSLKITRQSIIRELKGAFAEFYYGWRSHDIIAENLKLMRSFIEIIHKQYEVGMGKQTDILRAKTELARLLSDSIAIDRQISSMQGMINTLSSAPIDKPVGRVTQVTVPPLRLSLARLCSTALQNRPELEEMSTVIALRQAEAMAARKQLIPDFMIKTMYMNMVDSKDDEWSLMAGIRLPIAFWSSGRFTRLEEAKEHEKNGAIHDYDAMKTMIFSQIQKACNDIVQHQARERMYATSIVPLARQSLVTMTGGYSAGREEFAMLLETQKMVQMVTMEQEMAMMNLLQSIADLEFATGRELQTLHALDGGSGSIE